MADPYKTSGRIVVFGAGAGGSSGPPFDGTFLLETAHVDLPSGRVATDSATAEWDFSVPGEVRINVIGGGGGGSGDVVGPASAVDNRIATFDGTTGKLIQDSGTLISGLEVAGAAAAAVAAHEGAANPHPTYLTQAEADALYSALGHTHVLANITDAGALAALNTVGTTQIDNDAVTNAKLANVATATFKGRSTAGTGDPEDLTVAQAKTLLDLTGTNTGDQTVTLTGDVTGTGTGSFATTIANNAVTNAKLADMAAWSVKVRNAGTSGDPSDAASADMTEELTPASGDYLLGWDATGNLRKFDVGNLPTGGGGEANTASNVGVSGVGVFARKTGIDLEFKNLIAGSARLTVVDDTGDDEITLDVPAGAFEVAGAVAAHEAAANPHPTYLTQAEADALYEALGHTHPYTEVDTVPTARILGRTTAGTGAAEALTAASVKTFLDLTGTNSGDQTITLTGDVTGSGTGSFAATIANDAVTFAKMQNIGHAQVIGRSSSGTGDPEALTIGANQVLGYNGITLGGKSLTGSYFTDASITLVKLTSIDSQRILGRGDASAGVIAELSLETGITITTGEVFKAAGRYLRRTIYTTGSGTHTPGTDCNLMRVSGIGNGGGSGGAARAASQTGAGAGGAAGAWGEKIDANSGTYSYAIGAVGVKGAAGANAGGNGDDCTFTGTNFALVFKGGLGGAGGVATGTSNAFQGGSGLLCTGCDINGSGQSGFPSFVIVGSSGIAVSGQGGSSPWGRGGIARVSHGVGAAGTGFGAGGGGALAVTADREGADGSGGIIVVEEMS